MHRQSLKQLYAIAVRVQPDRTDPKIPSILHVVTRKIEAIRPRPEAYWEYADRNIQINEGKYMEQLRKSHEPVDYPRRFHNQVRIIINLGTYKHWRFHTQIETDHLRKRKNLKKLQNSCPNTERTKQESACWTALWTRIRSSRLHSTSLISTTIADLSIKCSTVWKATLGDHLPETWLLKSNDSHNRDRLRGARQRNQATCRVR